ncbi:MAG: accessory gene regulator B family protein [Bacilli bacterium]|nr:accessory gene regulator B family protein [Bacilli bacterium]
MKDKFINNCIKLITKYKHYSKADIAKMRYGLEGIYLTFYKMIILIVLSFLVGITKEFFLVIIFFNIIRFTGFGFHAEKSYQCLVISIIEFILLPLLLLRVYISIYFYYIVSFLCILTYLLYAPADTVKRPLPNKRKRMIRKSLTVIIGIIYLLLIIFVPNNTLTVILLSSLIIEAISVNPITYKIFKQPYRNYLNYSV